MVTATLESGKIIKNMVEFHPLLDALGRGIQKWKATQLVYEGYWENGKRCGPGILAVVGRNGRHTKIYSGMWKNNKRHVIHNTCSQYNTGLW